MKNRLKYLLAAPMLLFFLASCYEDKGNYDYTDVSDAQIDIPSITAKNNSISLTRIEEFKFDPEVTHLGKDASADYDYEWSMYDQVPVYNSGYAPKTVLAETKAIELDLGTMTPGEYEIVLRATHKTTTAVSYYRFKFQLSPIVGWIVLDQNASGDADISAIRDPQIVPGLLASNTGISKNIYSSENNGAKLRDVKFIYWRNMNNSASYNNLLVFKPNGVYKIGSGLYNLVSEDYDYFFRAKPEGWVAKPQAVYYESPYFGMVEVLMNDGKIYYINWRMMGSSDRFYGPAKVGDADLVCEPFIAGVPYDSYNNSARAVVYTKSTFPEGSFIVCDTWGSYSDSWIRPVVENGAFNPAKINADASTDYQLKYLATATDGTTGAIFRDEKADDKPYIFHGDFRDYEKPVPLGKYDISDLTSIAAANHFAFGTRGNVMFYASGRDVYSHAYPGGSNIKLLTVGAGETIHQIKLYTHTGNPDHSGRILFVATNGAGGGKVHKIRFNELTGALVDTPEVFEGFGTIIDMTIKE